MEFVYQAKNSQGLLVEGRIDAPNEDQAVNVLHEKGLVILSLDSTQKPFLSKDLLSFFGKPNKKDIALFTRQIATMVDADVPLVEGLHTISQQVNKESFKKIINTIAAAIEGGASLSLALSEHAELFGSFYVSLVKSGEVSGKLHTTLNYLADYLEKNSALVSKIRSALSYPIFVLFAIIVVSLIVMTVVMPKLLVILKDAGAENLPLSTRLLIWVTDFVNNYIILIIILLLGGIIGGFYYIRTANGRKNWDNFKINVPQFGSLIRNFYLARIGETLSTLIKAGVPILDGIQITSEVVGNVIYMEILQEAKANVRSGGTMSEVLARYEQFPALVSSMLKIGEKTGRTDFMLDNISKFYKAEAENTIQNLTQLIEPVLILLLGLAVGALVSAVLLPIYSLVGSA